MFRRKAPAYSGVFLSLGASAANKELATKALNSAPRKWPSMALRQQRRTSCTFMTLALLVKPSSMGWRLVAARLDSTDEAPRAVLIEHEFLDESNHLPIV